jgi:hypothetical protein
VKSLQQGSVEIVELSQMKTNLRAWTKRVYDNTPYHDDQLVAAKTSATASVIPHEVGAGSPIKHVFYIVKENRTTTRSSAISARVRAIRGSPSSARRSRPISMRCAPVRSAGQSLLRWRSQRRRPLLSNSAYATDFDEKLWPVTYGGHQQGSQGCRSKREAQSKHQKTFADQHTDVRPLLGNDRIRRRPVVTSTLLTPFVRTRNRGW